MMCSGMSGFPMDLEVYNRNIIYKRKSNQKLVKSKKITLSRIKRLSGSLLLAPNAL